MCTVPPLTVLLEELLLEAPGAQAMAASAVMRLMISPRLRLEVRIQFPPTELNGTVRIVFG